MLGGLGFLVGPIIGSGLNYGLGYYLPLFLYAAITLVLFMVLRSKLLKDEQIKK